MLKCISEKMLKEAIEPCDGCRWAQRVSGEVIPPIGEGSGEEEQSEGHIM